MAGVVGRLFAFAGVPCCGLSLSFLRDSVWGSGGAGRGAGIVSASGVLVAASPLLLVGLIGCCCRSGDRCLGAKCPAGPLRPSGVFRPRRAALASLARAFALRVGARWLRVPRRSLRRRLPGRGVSSLWLPPLVSRSTPSRAFGLAGLGRSVGLWGLRRGRGCFALGLVRRAASAGLLPSDQGCSWRGSVGAASSRRSAGARPWARRSSFVSAGGSGAPSWLLGPAVWLAWWVPLRFVPWAGSGAPAVRASRRVLGLWGRGPALVLGGLGLSGVVPCPVGRVFGSPG